MSLVLHVSQPTTAGVARYVADVTPRLADAGWTVAVACPSDGWLASSVAGSALVHNWDAVREPGVGTVAETRSLSRLIARVEPDLVHLHSAKAGLAGRLTLRGGRPTIFQPHAWSFAAVTGPTSWAARRWERYATRWADAIVCVSEAEKREGTDAGLVARWELINNGIDLSRWSHATDEQRRAARARLGLAEGPLAVTVGRIAPQKGQDVIVSAWPAISGAVPGARLVVVGDGPERAALEAMAVPEVTFAGESDEVDTWFAAANVIVIPSRWEGMSLSMLEAMARGRSVVSTAVAGAETIDGGGAVVPIGDTDALTAEVIRRLNDPELVRVEGAKARQRVESHHDIERVVEQLDATYRKVLSGRKG